MARTDYGAILSTVIQGTSNAIRHSEGTSSLIAPKDWAREINKLKVMPTKKVRGSICSFNDGADNSPIISLTASVSGSGCNVKNDVAYGGDVNFNQLSADFVEGNVPTSSTNGWYVSNGTATVLGGVATLTPTGQYGRLNCLLDYTANHKMFTMADIKLSNTTDANAVSFSIYGVDTSASGGTGRCSATTEWQTIARIYTHTSTLPNVNRIILTDARTSGWGTIQMKNAICIDLTQMFGETKANEIYAMEHATSGSGIAYVKSLLYKDYYAYNSGTVTNISAVNGDTDKYHIYPITFPSSVTSGSITINADGTVDLTSGGTTTRLTDTVDIRTYYGANNIWVDTGDISNLEYYADSELLYLGQMIEETATGDIASFSDGANNIPCPSVLCTINPVQDLHGQDYPYPSGGGKNKLPFTGGKTHTEHGITFVVDSDGNTKVTSSGVSEGGSFFNYYTLKLPVGTYYLQAYVNGSIWTYASGGKFRLYVAYNGSGYNFGGTLEVTDASKDIVVYIQAMTGVTYNDTVQLMISEGSTAPTKWSPYSNICPITGHTELNLVHTGANLWDEEWELGAINTTNGQNVSSSTTIRSKNYISCTPLTTYYRKTPQNIIPFFYTADKTYISFSGWGKDNTFTIPANAYYMRFYTDPAYGTTYNNDISINYPSSDTSYHAYTGTTTTTDLGTTVYGGSLNVTTGVLTLTHGFKTFTGDSSEAWTNVLNGFNIIISDAKQIQIPKANWLKGLTSQSITNLQSGECAFASSGALNFNCKYDQTADLTAWKTYLASNNLQVYYELATPTTTQLTPQEVKSLLGSNNFYHDCNGQVAVTYRANGQLYVEQHT